MDEGFHDVGQVARLISESVVSGPDHYLIKLKLGQHHYFINTMITQTPSSGCPKKRTFRIAGQSAVFRTAGQSPVTRPWIDQRLLIDGNSESAWDTLYVQVVSYIVDVLSSTWVLMYWQVEAGDGRSLQLVAFQAPEHPHSAPVFLQFLLQL